MGLRYAAPRALQVTTDSKSFKVSELWTALWSKGARRGISDSILWEQWSVWSRDLCY